MNTDAQGREHEQIPPPLIRQDVIDAAKQAAREEIAPSLAAMFIATPRPTFQAIYDLAAPQLVFGRAIIMGDAAFVARPHVGAGVTKAALDAACLADALADHDSIEAALAHYGRTRKAAGDWIIDRAREFGATCIHGKTDGAGRSSAPSARGRSTCTCRTGFTSGGWRRSRRSECLRAHPARYAIREARRSERLVDDVLAGRGRHGCGLQLPACEQRIPERVVGLMHDHAFEAPHEQLAFA